MDFAIWRKISFAEVWLILESWEVFVDFSFEWFSVSETMFASIQNLVHFKAHKVLNQHATNLRFKHVLSQKLFSSWCTIARRQLFVYNPAASKTRILSLWLQLHSLLFNFLSHGKVLEAKIGESKASEPKEAFKGHFVHERLRFIGCMHISKAFLKSMLRSFFYFLAEFLGMLWVLCASCRSF